MLSSLTLATSVPSAPDGALTLATWASSARSTSPKAKLPLATVVPSSVTAPLSISAAVTVGASLVPVMVIVTFCVTVEP
ncbi:hypothetical protein D3C78_1022060 [compost metagenome]